MWILHAWYFEDDILHTWYFVYTPNDFISAASFSCKIILVYINHQKYVIWHSLFKGLNYYKEPWIQFGFTHCITFLGKPTKVIQQKDIIPKNCR